MIVFDANVLSCFADEKTPYQIEELLDDHEHIAPGLPEPLTNNKDLCDTALLLHHQPIREL